MARIGVEVIPNDQRDDTRNGKERWRKGNVAPLPVFLCELFELRVSMQLRKCESANESKTSQSKQIQRHAAFRVSPRIPTGLREDREVARSMARIA